MSRAKEYSLLLLAGGKSSRMGKNKAELLYQGRTFVENLISKAERLGITQIYLSGYQETRKDVQMVQDIYPERGPLGGIHACMKVMQTPFCLVLPVDVPQIPVNILEELLEHHERNRTEVEGKQLPLLLEHGDRLENLIGIYSVTMMGYIEDMICEHPASVHRLLKEWGCVGYRMDIPDWQAANINTINDYEELLKEDFGKD